MFWLFIIAILTCTKVILYRLLKILAFGILIPLMLSLTVFDYLWSLSDPDKTFKFIRGFEPNTTVYRKKEYK